MIVDREDAFIKAMRKPFLCRIGFHMLIWRRDESAPLADSATCLRCGDEFCRISGSHLTYPPPTDG
jgi:hypothetical protein